MGTPVGSGHPADLAADDQVSEAALGGVVMLGHFRLGYEDEEFLDVALDTAAKLGW